jgi:hypothetical protein
VALWKLLQHACEAANVTPGLRIYAHSVLRLKASSYRAGGRRDNALWPNEELRLVACRLHISSPIYHAATCQKTSWGSSDIHKTNKQANTFYCRYHWNMSVATSPSGGPVLLEMRSNFSSSKKADRCFIVDYCQGSKMPWLHSVFLGGIRARWE